MIDFFTQNFAEIAGIAALVIIIAERIAKLTPTESDNKIVQAIRKTAKALGLDFPDVK